MPRRQPRRIAKQGDSYETPKDAQKPAHVTTVAKRGRGRPKGQPHTGGTKVGYKQAPTLAKEAAREAVRQRITERLVPIVDAQIDAALGIKHFMARNPQTGEWKRLQSFREIEQALNDPRAKDGSTYYIHTKDPNVQSARELLDRAIDRPREALEVVHDGGVTVRWLGPEVDLA